MLDHEKLIVHRRAIEFVQLCEPFISRLGRQARIGGRLDQACVLISLGVAEGSGLRTVKNRCRFFDIEGGDIAQEQAVAGEQLIREIVAMLAGRNKKLYQSGV